MPWKSRLVHVPYRGTGPALTDLLGGQVQIYFDAIPSSIEYIRAGRFRALAVTTATRSEALPDIPILGDFVPGYEASFWYFPPSYRMLRSGRRQTAALSGSQIKAPGSAVGYLQVVSHIKSLPRPLRTLSSGSYLHRMQTVP